MKKIVLLLFALITVFSLFSCGDPNEGFTYDQEEKDPYDESNKYGDAYADEEGNIVLPPIKVN